MKGLDVAYSLGIEQGRQLVGDWIPTGKQKASECYRNIEVIVDWRIFWPCHN